MTLTLKPADWEATVQASPDCLLQEQSAKCVEHVLSKAVTRGPQKILGRLVSDKVELLLSSPSGVRILIALVSYGTVRTVSLLCDRLNARFPPIDAGKEDPIDYDALALLFRAVAVRVDDTSEARQQLLSRLTSRGWTALVDKPACLRFAAQLALADDAFFSTISSLASKQSSPLRQVLASVKKPREAIYFVETLLQGVSGQEDKQKLVCRTILQAISDQTKEVSAHRPRVEILAALATHGDVETASTMAKFMSKWSQLGSMASSTDASAVLSALLSRADDASASLLAKRITEQTSIAELSKSNKASVLAIVATMQKRFPALHGDANQGVLAGAAARYVRATKPLFEATTQRILEKIQSLTSAQPSPMPAVVPAVAPALRASGANRARARADAEEEDVVANAAESRPTKKRRLSKP